jgi:hypothetical protein
MRFISELLIQIDLVPLKIDSSETGVSVAARG